MSPAQVGTNGLLMSPALQAAQRVGGTWSRLFRPDDVANQLPFVAWWLAIELAGLAALPATLLAHALATGSWDMDWPRRSVCLAFSYLAWLAASFRLAPWSRATLALALLLLLVGAAVAGVAAPGDAAGLLARVPVAHLVQRGGVHRRVCALCAPAPLQPGSVAPVPGRREADGALVPERRGALDLLPALRPLVCRWLPELLLLRVCDRRCPDQAHRRDPRRLVQRCRGGRVCPDGRRVLHVRLQCRALAAAVGRHGPAGRRASGLLAALFVAGVGNLDALNQLQESLARAGGVSIETRLPGVAGVANLLAGGKAVLFDGQALPGLDFWRSSRVIPNNTINEFPFFTFLFADLHAHMIVMPLTAAMLALGLNLLGSGWRDPQPLAGRPLRWAWRALGVQRIWHILLVGWLLGAIAITNSWDFPTYLLVIVAALALAEWRAAGVTWQGAVRCGGSAVAVYAVSRLAFQPFWSHFELFYTGITPFPDKSRLDHYLIIHGFFLFILGSFLLVEGARAWSRSGWGRYLGTRLWYLGRWERLDRLEHALIRDQRLPALPLLTAIAIFAVVVATLVRRQLPLVAFIAALIGLVLLVAWERRHSAHTLFLLLLIGAGAALSMFVEFYALRGDVGRMNTVFKLFLQVWMLWALVSAVAATWLLGRLWGWAGADPRAAKGAGVECSGAVQLAEAGLDAGLCRLARRGADLSGRGNAGAACRSVQGAAADSGRHGLYGTRRGPRPGAGRGYPCPRRPRCHRLAAA